MSILFKDVDVWQRQRPSLRQDILEWHWQMLHEGYEAKVSAKDPVVFRHSGGFAHQMTFHAFIFSILGAIHKVVGEDRAAIARTIVGDFKCLSMNPIGRHTGKRIGVPAGVVAKAKAKAVAAPVVSEQGDEGDLVDCQQDPFRSSSTVFVGCRWWGGRWASLAESIGRSPAPLQC